MSSVVEEKVVPLVAVLTLPAAALASMFWSTEAAAVVAIVGWFVLVPGLAVLFGEEDTEWDGADEASEEDPLETLRDRYARGELSEAEFERRVERLLETEDVDVPESASLDGLGEESVSGDPGRERDPERERER